MANQPKSNNQRKGLKGDRDDKQIDEGIGREDAPIGAPAGQGHQVAPVEQGGTATGGSGAGQGYTGPTPVAAGTLRAPGLNDGGAAFEPIDNKPGTLGRFTVEPGGAWSYQLDNSQPAVRALRPGSQLVDTVIVSGVDGTSHEITVRIDGTEAGAVIGSSVADQLPSGGAAKMPSARPRPSIDGPNETPDQLPPAMKEPGQAEPPKAPPTLGNDQTPDMVPPAMKEPGQAEPPKAPPTLGNDQTPDLVPPAMKEPGQAEPPKAPPTLGNDQTPDMVPPAMKEPGQAEPPKAPPTLGNDQTPDMVPPAMKEPGQAEPPKAPPTLGNDQTPDMVPPAMKEPGQAEPPKAPPTLGNDQTPDMVPPAMKEPGQAEPPKAPPTLGNDQTPDMVPPAMKEPGQAEPPKAPPTLGNDQTPDLVPPAMKEPGQAEPPKAPPTLGNDQTPDMVPPAMKEPGQAEPPKAPPTLGNDQTPSTVPHRAVIGGADAGSVTEDSMLAGGSLQTGGTLTIIDVDPGEAAFTSVAVGAGTYGVFTVDADGSWTYTADNTQSSVQALKSGDQLTDTLTVSSADGTTHQITVTINGSDDRAVIGGTAVGAVTEDQQARASGQLTVSDVDAGQGLFVPMSDAAGSHGTFTVAPDGSWSYQLDNTQSSVQALKSGDQLTDTLTVSSADGTTHQITVTINGSDDRAVIGGTAVGAVTEDQQARASGQLTVSDVDAGQGLFVPMSDAAGSHGTFTVAPDGSWSYQLDNTQSSVQALKSGDQLTDTLTVSSADGTTHQITVTINGSDDRAVIGGTAVGAVTEDQQARASGQLTVSDVDAGQGLFVPMSDAAGSHGTFTVAPDGSWSYQLDNTQSSVQALKSGDQLTDTLTVSSADGTTHQITVTINGSDDRAVIGGTAVGAVTEDQQARASGQLTVSDVDAGQGLFVPMSDAAGSHGTFTVAPDGSWSYQLDNTQSSVQALKSGDQLTDTLTVSSADGTTHQITVTINGSDDRAVIGGTAVGAVTEDQQARASGQLTVSDVDAGQGLFVPMSDAAGSHGTFTVAPDGSWSYQLDNTQSSVQALKSGDQLTDTLTVSSADGTTHQITVTINGSDDRAVIGGTAVGAVTEDRALRTGGKLEVKDPDAGEAVFVPQTDAPGSHGTFTVAPDGTWSYQLDNAQTAVQALPGARGKLTDTITVSTMDGTAQQITVTIAGHNDNPVITTAIRQVDGDVREDSPAQVTASGTLAATDVDHEPGDLTWNVVRGGHGTYGNVAIDARTGQWTYTLDNARPETQALGDGEVVTDQIQVGVMDPVHGFALRTLHIHVTGTNDSPVITLGATDSDTGAVTEDAARTTASGQLSATDVDGTDPASSLDWSVDPASAGVYGTLSVDASGQWTYTLDNSRPATQALAEGQTVQESFEVRVTDPHNATATHTVTVDVTGAPDGATIAGTDTGTVTEDTGLTGAGDLTAGGTLAVSDPDAGQAVFVPQTGAAGTYGTFTLDAQGNWTYTADNSQQAIQELGRGQSLTDTLQVSSVDGTTHTVSVEIKGLIDAPALTVTGSQGTDQATATAGTSATATLAALEDTVISLDITTDLFDKDPTQHLGASLSIDGVPPGATLNYGVEDSGHPGRWNVPLTELTGLELTPPKDFSGPITLKVTEVVTDLSAGEGRPIALSTATLHVNVAPQNDMALIGGQDTGSVTEDSHLQAGQLHTGGVLTVTDADTGEAAFTPLTGTAGAGTYGTFTLSADGHWTYIADNAQSAIDQLGPKESLTDSLTVTSVDGTTHDLTVTIAGHNDNPVITTAIRQVDGDVREDSPAQVTASGTLAATDVDHEPGDLTWNVVRGGHGTYGSVTIDARTGQWTYTLDNARPETQALGEGEVVTDQIQVGVTDPVHGFALRTLHIHVTGTNDSPVITLGATDSDTGAVTEDAARTTASGQLSATDVDGTDPASSLDWSVDPASAGVYGTLSVDASGQWTYTLDNSRLATQALAEGQPTTETFRVIATDATGTQDTHEVTIDVTGASDGAVIAGTDTGVVTEDTALTGGDLTAGGMLTITDPDAGEAAFTPVTGAAGTYGTFSLDAQGNWTYTADNSQQAIQELNQGSTPLTDTLTVTSVDGTMHDITVAIQGTNDAPVVTTGDLGTTVEDTARTFTTAELLQSVSATDAEGDTLSITSVSVDSTAGVIADNGDGTFTFSPSASFKGDDIAVTVRVTDGADVTTAQATLDVTPVTDAAAPSLTVKAEQQVMSFDNQSASAIFTNEAVSGSGMHGFSIEMTVIGGQQVASDGIHGATLMSYETSPHTDELYVYKPDSLTVRVGGSEHDTGVAMLNDGQDHRYGFIWDGQQGTLDVMIDGHVVKHMDGIAQGYTVPSGGSLAFGGDQDSMRGGFSVNDAFNGQMFSASMASNAVDPAQLENAQLGQVLRGDPALLTDVQMVNGQVHDHTGHFTYGTHGGFLHQTVQVDTALATPNPGATLILEIDPGAPADTDDTVTGVVLRGLPEGTLVTDSHGNSATIAGGQPVDVTGWLLSSIEATPPLSFISNFRLVVDVVTEGPDGSRAVATSDAPIILDPTQPSPAADAPESAIDGEATIYLDSAHTQADEQGLPTSEMDAFSVADEAGFHAVADGAHPEAEQNLHLGLTSFVGEQASSGAQAYLHLAEDGVGASGVATDPSEAARAYLDLGGVGLTDIQPGPLQIEAPDVIEPDPEGTPLADGSTDSGQDEALDLSILPDPEITQDDSGSV